MVGVLWLRRGLVLGLDRGLGLRLEGVPGVRLRRRRRPLGLRVLGGRWVGGELFVCDEICYPEVFGGIGLGIWLCITGLSGVEYGNDIH